MLNFTRKKTIKEMEEETSKWLKRLNQKFGNPLKDLYKTGGEDQNTANQVKERNAVSSPI